MLIDPHNIDEICTHIKSNKPIAYPTETVFGLGGNALSDALIIKIYALKKRSPKKPFIVLVKDLSMLKKYTAHLPNTVQSVLQKFWPGHLSILLPSQHLPEILQNPEGETAFRQSSHPFVKNLFKQLEIPLISTSANESGQTPLLNYANIQQQFTTSELMIVKDNISNPQKPSTLVRFKGDQITLLREGSLELDRIIQAYKESL